MGFPPLVAAVGIGSTFFLVAGQRSSRRTSAPITPDPAFDSYLRDSAMSVPVASPDSPAGIAALSAEAAEAHLLATDLIVSKLSPEPLDSSTVPGGLLSRVSRRLLLESPVPVAAVKLRDEQDG